LRSSKRGAADTMGGTTTLAKAAKSANRLTWVTEIVSVNRNF
jgi:hypothetical protein